jgi:hypothetical protein
LATELAKAQVSAIGDMPPPSNFGLKEDWDGRAIGETLSARQCGDGLIAAE